MAKILPAIFFGHGNPMSAVLDNGYTKAWTRIGQTTPKPKAILSISAHWFVSETGVTIATSPRTNPKLQYSLKRKGLDGNALLQRGAFHEFHCNEGLTVVFADFIEGANIGWFSAEAACASR
jgi:hypothetical protein